MPTSVSRVDHLVRAMALGGRRQPDLAPRGCEKRQVSSALLKTMALQITWNDKDRHCLWQGFSPILGHES